MELREDVYDIKKELQEVKKESFAFSILSDYKRQNKRLFIALVIVLVMWFTTLCYLVYILVDTGVVEERQEINDIDTIENSNITNGSNNG